MFYAGALGATLAVGIIAAFVLGDVAASNTSSPKTWVAIVDIVAAGLLLGWVLRVVRRPVDPEKLDGMLAQISKVCVPSPVIVIIGAGAAGSREPGAFIPIALKTISETDPTAPAEYIVNWLFFSLVSLLPLRVSRSSCCSSPEPAPNACSSRCGTG